MDLHGPEARTPPPPLPELEWNMVPESHSVVTVRVQECNWLQALEGEIDSAHAAILHGRRNGSTIAQWRRARTCRPQVRGPAARCRHQHRGAAQGRHRAQLRAGQPVPDAVLDLGAAQTQYPELSGHAWVPIDDHHTLAIMFSYTPDQPFYESRASCSGTATRAARPATIRMAPMRPGR